MRLAFVEDMRGYRVRASLIELWDEVPLYSIKGAPYPLITDYAAYFERRGEPLPPPGRRPFLLGVMRQEVLTDFGRAVGPAFVYTPPRLGFTRAEQRSCARQYSDPPTSSSRGVSSSRWIVATSRLG